jgi:hypothetical protein
LVKGERRGGDAYWHSHVGAKSGSEEQLYEQPRNPVAIDAIDPRAA